jgi:hypothetical protein
VGLGDVKQSSKQRESRNIPLCVITLSRGIRDAPIRSLKLHEAVIPNLFVVMSCLWLGRFSCN